MTGPKALWGPTIGLTMHKPREEARQHCFRYLCWSHSYALKQTELGKKNPWKPTLFCTSILLSGEVGIASLLLPLALSPPLLEKEQPPLWADKRHCLEVGFLCRSKMRLDNARTSLGLEFDKVTKGARMTLGATVVKWACHPTKLPNCSSNNVALFALDFHQVWSSQESYRQCFPILPPNPQKFQRRHDEIVFIRPCGSHP